MVVSLEDIKKIRELTGAGLNVCREALEESKNDFDKAVDYIRKKGELKASQRAGKSASKGVIGVYEHKVDFATVSLVEINCETDFVARNPMFLELSHNIAMQVAATNPKYVSRDNIPSEEIEKEKKLWRDEFLKQGKPENVVDSIVENKMKSYYEQVCLLDQSFIKDDKKKISDIINEAVARFGEKIQIKRFIIWEVGG